jgi:hypothetical protein
VHAWETVLFAQVSQELKAGRTNRFGKTALRRSGAAKSSPTGHGERVQNRASLHERTQVRFCRDRFFPTGD